MLNHHIERALAQAHAEDLRRTQTHAGRRPVIDRAVSPSGMSGRGLRTVFARWATSAPLGRTWR